MTSTYEDRTLLAADVAIKAPCRAATTAAITLSGLQTVDGIALVANDRVLVKNQASGSANGIYCVDQLTEILSKNGFKPYSELKDGEDVLTLNLETGLAEWQPVLSVHAFPVQDIEMLSMEAKCHSSLSTMNHRWPVSRRYPPVERFPRKRFADGTFAPWTEPLPAGPYLTIRESRDLTSEDYIVRTSKCATLPTGKKYEDAFVELVAWFITEGHIRKNNSGTLSACVDIVQSISANPEKVERIRACLMALFGEPTPVMKRERNGAWKPEWRSVETHNHDMMEFCLNREAGKLLCEVAPNRVVKAEFIAALCEDQLSLFVDTCMAADGHVHHISGQRSFCQKRLDMLAPVQMACTLLGIATNVFESDGLNYMSLSRGGRLRQGLRGPSRASPQQVSRTVKYSGIVWCPKTKNQTWLARRNGSVYFTGNTVSTGSWTRTSDFDGNRDVVDGSLVFVRSGTANALGLFMCSAATTPAVIGTTSLAFNLVSVVIGNAGVFTTISASGQITSSLVTGTAPLVIASTTKVANLNVDLLDGTDWNAPGPIGAGTPSTAAFTTVTASTVTTTGAIVGGTTGKLATTLGVGNATPAASGAGVSFPATQSASTDANTLDDYEEGTWTPSVGGSATYTQNTGNYIKIGKLVYVSCNLIINAIGTGSTTAISGLPFTSGINFDAALAISRATVLATAVVWVAADIQPNSSSITLTSRVAAAANDAANPIFGNGATLFLSGCYAT